MFTLFVIGGAVGSSWGGPAGWAAFAMVPGGPAVRLVAAGSMALDAADLLPFEAAAAWHRANHTPGKALFITDSTELVARAPKIDGYDVTWHFEARRDNTEVFEEAERARSEFAEAYRRCSPVAS